MIRILTFAIFILTTTSLTSAYDDFLGPADEYDHEGSRYMKSWDLTQNLNIWDEDMEKADPQPKTPRESLEKLCDNYNLAIDGHVINCKDLKLLQKSLKVDKHMLRKREAEPEAPLDEGSGDGEKHQAVEDHHGEAEKVPAETSTAQGEREHTATEHQEQRENIFQYQSANVVDENTADVEKGGHSMHVDTNAEIKELTDSEGKQTEDKLNSNGEQHPDEHKAEEKPNVEVPTVENSTETTATENKREENPIQEPINETTVSISESLVTVEAKPKEDEKPKEENPKEEVKPTNEVNIPTSLAPQTQPQPEIVAPKVSQEVSVKDDATITDGKEFKTHENSVANSISDGQREQNSGAGEKKGRKLENNNEQTDTDKQRGNTDSGSVGEIKESTSQKDTKILVGLLGAVLAVGAAAFAYNYIKKKKRANTARTATNGVGKNDPEEGKEMKPLMKIPDVQKQTVEYKDETQDKTEEVKS